MKATIRSAKRPAKIQSKATQQKNTTRKTFQQPAQKEIALLIKTIWGVASSSLWFHKIFDANDIAQYQELISEHFFNGQDAKRNFKELVQRLCLAKRYVARKRGRYISKPQDYLNIHYPLGLAGTAAWLEQVKQVRKEVPEYNKGITTLAKALLSYLENPSVLSFHKGRKQLTDQNQFDLLQIYNNTIIHLQFN